MKLLNRSTLVFALLLSATQVQAEEVSLKIQWPAGKRIVKVNNMDMTQKMLMPGMPAGGMDMTMTQSQEMILEITKQDEGGKIVDVRISKVKMSMKNPMMNMEFDSEAENGADAGANPLAAMGKMVDQPFQFIVNDKEEITDVKGLDTLVSSMDPSGSTPNPFSDPDTVKNMVQANYMSGFDGTPRKVGDTWNANIDFPLPAMGDMKSDVTFTLVGTEEKDGYECALINLSGTFDLSQPPSSESILGSPMANMKFTKGIYTGKMWFSPELGIEIATEMTQEIHMEMDMGEQKMSAEMHMEIENRTTSVTDL